MRRTGFEFCALLRHCLTSRFIETQHICYARYGSDLSSYSADGSWNAAINGYCMSGNPQHALHLYQELQTHVGSLQLKGYTYVLLLKACAELQDHGLGSLLHVEVARTGNVQNPFVGSALVDMYMKCGLLVEAQEAFDGLPSKDTVTWTTLMAGYAEHGCTEEALLCFEKMQLSGAFPDAHTFVCVLKVCSSLRALEKGESIHAKIELLGLAIENLHVASALVDLYAKCGSLGKAQEVFGRCVSRNTVLWNVLILGYAEYGYNEEVLKKFEEMQVNGFSPTIVSYVCVLKVCGNIGALDKGLEIHAEIKRRGLLETDTIVGNVLVDMYAKCGVLVVMQEMFDGLPSRDVVPWTTLISGYVQCGQYWKAVKCFNQMHVEGVFLNAATCVCIFTACANEGAVTRGREVHAKLEIGGFFGRDTLFGNALVNMYSKCGVFSIAEQVFDKLLIRSVASWTSLIGGYVEHGQGQRAFECYQKMKFLGVFPNEITLMYVLKACSSIGVVEQVDDMCAEIERLRLLDTDLDLGNALIDAYAKCGSLIKAHDVFYKLPLRDSVSYGTLIAGYVGHGKSEDALKCLDGMRLEGIFPNVVTYACILKSCGSLGAEERGSEVHMAIEKRGLLEANPVFGNILVDMYGKLGLLAAAQSVFNRLSLCDLVSWNALMGGYAWLGESELVFSLFEQMQRKGLKPDLVTFVVILSACRHLRLYGNENIHFEIMRKEYGIFPLRNQYAWVIDLLGHSLHLDMAMINGGPLCQMCTTHHS